MGKTNSKVLATFATSELTVRYGITNDNKVIARMYFDKLKKSGVEIILDKSEAKVFGREILRKAGISNTILKQIQ